MIIANSKNNIHCRVYVLFFVLIHRINSHIANHIDIAEWSDGKELLGKNLCNNVSSSYPNNIIVGLDLVKKNCMHIFITAVIIADQKTRSADSLILSLFFINQIIYKVINNIGNKNTNISAVIGITFSKKS